MSATPSSHTPRSLRAIAANLRATDLGKHIDDAIKAIEAAEKNGEINLGYTSLAQAEEAIAILDFARSRILNVREHLTGWVISHRPKP